MPQKLIFLNGIDKAYPRNLQQEMIKRAMAKQASVEAGELPDLPPSPVDLPQPAQPIESYFADRLMSHVGSPMAISAIDYMKGKPTLSNESASNWGILASPSGKRE